MNAQLFDRSSKRAQLTEAGQRLLPVAGKMLNLRDQLQKEAHSSARLAGVCRFGVSELVSLTWLPDFARLVNQDHPGLVLEPYVDLARNLERKVQRGELDFSIAPGPVRTRKCRATLSAVSTFPGLPRHCA
ncbi:MAG: LysR family transcriptional regulator [Proteobacteria bacterium]|nr:MAG: LysR family transcriptional regulator [Pseudomonadota bacterium]